MKSVKEVFVNKSIKEKDDKIAKLEGEIERLNKIISDHKYADEFLQIHHISTDRICCDTMRDCTQDRDFFRLTQSIKQQGIIEPLIVKRISVDSTIEGGLYTLISGNRRIQAARLIGLDKVPVIILHNQEEPLVLTYLLSDLCKSRSIIEKSTILSCIIEKYKGEAEQVLNNLCITKENFAQLESISTFSDQEIEMCKTYNLTDQQIALVGEINDEVQRKIAIRHIGSSNLSLRQTVEYLYDIHSLTPSIDCKLPSKSKMILKDMRLFYNTIDRAIDTFSESGIRADCKKKESPESFTITINIYKAKLREL